MSRHARRVRILTDNDLMHMRIPPDYEEYFLTSGSAKNVEYLYVVDGDGISSSSLPYVRLLPAHRMTFSSKPGYVVNPENLPASVRDFVW